MNYVTLYLLNFVYCRCIKTYEIEFSSAASGKFHRVNPQDTILLSFQYSVPTGKCVHTKSHPWFWGQVLPSGQKLTLCPPDTIALEVEPLHVYAPLQHFSHFLNASWKWCSVRVFSTASDSANWATISFSGRTMKLWTYIIHWLSCVILKRFHTP
jgi:hypothetical protein